MSESSWVEQGKKAKRNRLIAFAFVLVAAVVALVIYNNREMLPKSKIAPHEVSHPSSPQQKVDLPQPEAGAHGKEPHKASEKNVAPVVVPVKKVVTPPVVHAEAVALPKPKALACTLFIAGIMSPVLGQNDLQVRISLGCIGAHAAACKALAHQPDRVRALCVRTLASTTLDNMNAEKLREKLARDLRGLGGEVTDVFFTEFMIDRIAKQ